jgi:hypothetical protein
MADLEFVLVDETTFDDIPAPARPGARCQTCDYWERIDGTRDAPESGATDATARASLKRSRLLASRDVAGSYGMLAYRPAAGERVAVAYAQFGPLSAYPRAQSIRERYPDLPDSPAPWVVTCLQVVADMGDPEAREAVGVALLEAVCDELDRRGITAIEAYPEPVRDPWLPPSGPATVYRQAVFDQVAGDERYPVYRRELSGETDADAWSGLLKAAAPDEGDAWPLPLPKPGDADDFFRLPPERPKRPNPFGDD